jgi:hypothetical protein
MLQQLTGLKRLDIHSCFLVSHTEVLKALQELTHLAVREPYQWGSKVVGLEGVCAALSGRLPKLQQLVYLDSTERTKPPSFGMYGEGWKEAAPGLLPGVQVVCGSVLDRKQEYTGDNRSARSIFMRPRQLCPFPPLPGVWELDPPVVSCSGDPQRWVARWEQACANSKAQKRVPQRHRKRKAQ